MTLLSIPVKLSSVDPEVILLLNWITLKIYD